MTQQRPGYLALWRDRVRILRPQNGAIAAVGVAVGAILVAGTNAITATVAAAAIAAFLVTSFGNVVNDVVDRHIDKAAHPKRPVAAGRVRPRDALAFATILLGVGLWEAWIAGGLALLGFAGANAAILVLYETWAKKRGLLGNMLVGALVGSTFLFGAVAVGSPTAMVALLAIMAALTTVGRELIKDVQDMEADRPHRSTLPVRHGARAARAVAATAALAAVAMSLLVFHPAWQPAHATWAPAWLIILLLADLDFLAAVVVAPHDPRWSQLLYKLGMVVALGAFLTGPLLAA